MVGRKPGGVNVFGGGLGLDATGGVIVGGVGVSGDTSCTDHPKCSGAGDQTKLPAVQ